MNIWAKAKRYNSRQIYRKELGVVDVSMLAWTDGMTEMKVK